MASHIPALPRDSRLCKCFVPTALASPEFLTVARGIVKDNPTDIPFVVAALLCVAVIQ